MYSYTCVFAISMCVCVCVPLKVLPVSTVCIFVSLAISSAPECPPSAVRVLYLCDSVLVVSMFPCEFVCLNVCLWDHVSVYPS